jgi:hypothetical protein
VTEPNTPTRSETQAIEVEVDQAAVVTLLADGVRIPEWAPGFADRVMPKADGRWRVNKVGSEFDIDIAVNLEAGTVDYLREISPGRTAGLRSRAVPRMGGGTVVVITLPVLPGGDPADVAAILSEELDAFARLL